MTRKQIMGRAGSKVENAILSGKMKRGPCESCGRPSTSHMPSHAHHDDYSKPLDVRWLCASCHKQHHLKHGPGLMPAEQATT